MFQLYQTPFNQTGDVVKKFDHPKKEDFDLCTVLDALSDPLRLEFIQRIWTEGECCCGSFSEPKAKSTRSHHFKVLRESGLIMTRIHGTEYGLSLRKEELDERFPGLMDSVLSVSAAAKKRISLKAKNISQKK